MCGCGSVYIAFSVIVCWCVWLAAGAFGEEEQRRHTGVCIDCGGKLELYLLDLKRSKRILLCTRCGLYHIYRKDMLGKWKIVKVAKVADL
jgi:hypothetical protein